MFKKIKQMLGFNNPGTSYGINRTKAMRENERNSIISYINSVRDAANLNLIENQINSGMVKKSLYDVYKDDEATIRLSYNSGFSLGSLSKWFDKRFPVRNVNPYYYDTQALLSAKADQRMIENALKERRKTLGL